MLFRIYICAILQSLANGYNFYKVSVGFETQIIQNTTGCFLDNFYVNKQVVIFRC